MSFTHSCLNCHRAHWHTWCANFSSLFFTLHSPFGCSIPQFCMPCPNCSHYSATVGHGIANDQAEKKLFNIVAFITLNNVISRITNTKLSSLEPKLFCHNNDLHLYLSSRRLARTVYNGSTQRVSPNIIYLILCLALDVQQSFFFTIFSTSCTGNNDAKGQMYKINIKERRDREKRRKITHIYPSLALVLQL